MNYDMNTLFIADKILAFSIPFWNTSKKQNMIALVNRLANSAP